MPADEKVVSLFEDHTDIIRKATLDPDSSQRFAYWPIASGNQKASAGYSSVTRSAKFFFSFSTFGAAL